MAGTAAMVFFGSALGPAAVALLAGFAASLTGLAATATGFLVSALSATLPDLAAGAALDFLDVVTGTGELTLGMDFLGTALDATTGVALALTGRDFLAGAAFFAWAVTIGLEGFEILLEAFVDVLLLMFLLIFTLFLLIN